MMFEHVVFKTSETDNSPIDLYADHGLVLGACQFPAPDLKGTFLSAPAIQGELDLSESLTGGPVYNSRSVHMEFTGHYYKNGIASREACREKYIAIRNALHGKRLLCYCPRWGTGYIEGRVKVHSEEVVAANGLKIQIDMEHCNPFILTGSTTVTVDPSEYPITYGSWKPIETNVPQGFEDFGSIQVRYYTGQGQSGASPYSTKMGLYAAKTQNLFDFNSTHFYTFTQDMRNPSSPGNWVNNKTSQKTDEQSVWYSSTAKTWNHCFILTAGTPNEKEAGFNEVFPFTCYRPYVNGQSGYVNYDVWLTCFVKGEITDLDNSTKSIRVKLGDVDLDHDPTKPDDWSTGHTLSGPAYIPSSTGEFSTALKIHLTRTSQWDGETAYVFTDGWGVVQVETKGITAKDLSFQLMLSYSEPQSWVESDVTTSWVQLPSRFQHTASVTDVVTLDPTSVTVLRNTKNGSRPDIADPISPAVIFEQSEMATWDVSGALYLWAAMTRVAEPVAWGDYYEIRSGVYPSQTVTLQKGAMRTVPVVSCGSDTVMVIDDIKLLIPAGTTAPLPIIIGDVDEIEVLILGDQPMTITYENGTL